MAGTVSGFDPVAFRTGIRSAMTMGAPVDVSRRATFFFATDVSADGPIDAEGVPFAPETTVTRTPYEHSQVPVGVEYTMQSGSLTSVGEFQPDRVVLTLLDEDYAQVVGPDCPNTKGFEFVVISGTKYEFKRELVERALGSVGVHQLLCEAVD